VAGWAAGCVIALALFVGLLALVFDPDDDGEPSTGPRPETGEWEVLPAPPVSGRAVADGYIVLGDLGGRLVAFTEGPEGAAVRLLDGGVWSDPVAVPGPARVGAVVVTTPRELVVWGGRIGQAQVNDGFAYRPDSGWLPMTFAALPPDPGAIGVWTGREVVFVAPGTGQAAAYYPEWNAWLPLPPAAGLAGSSIMATATTGRDTVLWAYDEGAHRARLLALDVEAAAWSELTAPPFYPPAGGAGLAGDGAGLVATTTVPGAARAAHLAPAAVTATADPAPPGGGTATEWEWLSPPPMPADAVCPTDLQSGDSAIVLVVECSGDVYVHEDGDEAWRQLPSLPTAVAWGEAAGGDTWGRALVAGKQIYYLTPGETEPTLLRYELR
jgi:hypothetical protein